MWVRMLDVDTVILFLLRRGLVRTEEVFASRVVAEAIPRRNRNLRVVITDGNGFFVKQPETETPNSRQTLRAELAFYSNYASVRCPVSDYLARVVLYDSAEPLLVLELLPDYDNLWAYYRSFPPHRFPIHIVRTFGHRLGGIHRALADRESDHPDRSQEQCQKLPWVAHAHKPSPEFLSTLSPAALSVLGILQNSTVTSEGLERIGQLWESDTVIHGDIRGDNILVREGDDADDLRIVDWELAGIGDRAWDVASFLQDLVAFWLGGLPLGGQQELTEIAAESSLPWPVFQSACRAFYEGYLAAAGCDDILGQVHATKVVYFTAARMVQFSLEMTAESAEIAPVVVLLLQVCENLFGDPERAATNFLAIA